MAGARGEGDELGDEAVVGRGKIEGGRKVLRHVADAEGALVVRHGDLVFELGVMEPADGGEIVHGQQSVISGYF